MRSSRSDAGCARHRASNSTAGRQPCCATRSAKSFAASAGSTAFSGTFWGIWAVGARREARPGFESRSARGLGQRAARTVLRSVVDDADAVARAELDLALDHAGHLQLDLRPGREVAQAEGLDHLGLVELDVEVDQAVAGQVVAIAEHA